MQKHLLIEKIKKIGLIIFDVDGVLTNGQKFYDVNGHKMAKSFSDLDFTAIKILSSIGIKVVWLSGDQSVNSGLAKIKNIPFYCTRLTDGRFKDKDEYLFELLETYNLKKNNVWFIGDDIFDLKIIREVGLSSCPANASFLIRKEVDVIHKVQGGNNLASEILELVFDAKKIKTVDIDKVYKLQDRDIKTQENNC